MANSSDDGNSRTPVSRHAPAASASPNNEIKIGLLVIGIFLVGISIWAALTPLDSAVYAPGQIVVSGHRQTLQHREGGVIRTIRVREGQHVDAGEVLLELVGGDVRAARDALAAQTIDLQAERARLAAEQVGSTVIGWPREYQGLDEPDLAEAHKAVDAQRDELIARAGSLTAHQAVLTKRRSELEDQIRGYQEQLNAVKSQQKLVNEELVSMKSLADQGYAPMSQVRLLERTGADLEGRVGQYAAGIAQSREQMEELQLQVVQLKSENQEAVAKDLRDVDFQLSGLSPRYSAATDQLARMQMRAPTAGTVVGLNVFTVGGVIAPGQRVMDIVPDHAPLVIAAQILPGDADGLYVGQITEVRLGSSRDRTLPILKGTLTSLSADSLVNDKNGAAFYAAEVTIPPDQLRILQQSKGHAIDFKPGLPAQILIPLGKRSALQFLFDPLTRTVWKSFRER